MPWGERLGDLKSTNSTRVRQRRGASRKQPKKQGPKKQSRPKIIDRLTSFLLLRIKPMCVGCGHATACGHPQLDMGRSFTLYELSRSYGVFA
jgi:hypothetical protein